MSLRSTQTDTPDIKNYKLDRITRAAELAGNPQCAPRRTIIVAGTNAKGSLVRYLSALFEATHLKVGSYYSPHVISRTERIQVNSRSIHEDDWKRIEARYPEAFLDLSFFENATLAAWIYFRDQKVDLQVLEVGMGGRLDATNICSPDVSVIGPIGMDHAEVLGDSLSKIAREKAGVMRKDKPAFVEAHQETESLDTLIECADELGAKLELSSAADTEAEKKVYEAMRFRGEHQARNALLAYRVYVAACEDWKLNSLSINQLVECLASASLPGRIQIIKKDPLWIFDGSHNLQSIEAFLAYLKSEQAELCAEKKFEMIFGMMNDKEWESALRRLSSVVARLHLISFYPEREISPEAIYVEALALGLKVRIWSKLSDLLGDLEARGNPLLVCGSFYLVGEVLRGINDEQST